MGVLVALLRKTITFQPCIFLSKFNNHSFINSCVIQALRIFYKIVIHCTYNVRRTYRHCDYNIIEYYNIFSLLLYLINAMTYKVIKCSVKLLSPCTSMHPSTMVKNNSYQCLVYIKFNYNGADRNTRYAVTATSRKTIVSWQRKKLDNVFQHFVFLPPPIYYFSITTRTRITTIMYKMRTWSLRKNSQFQRVQFLLVYKFSI